MKRPREVVALLLAALLLCGTQEVGAKPYALRARGDALSLVNTKTGHVLWTRPNHYAAFIWSADGRAVALESGASFLMWRQGNGLASIKAPPIPGSRGRDHYEYALGGVWAPDKRRFLARFGIKTMSDVGPTGVGRLFCFKLSRKAAPRTFVLPSASYATKMAWRDNRTALYWPDDFDGNGKLRNGKPRIWRVP